MVNCGVGRGLGEPLSNHVVRKIVKHKGGSIMVRGYMSQEGIGEPTKIEGKINSKQYHKTLSDNTMSLVKLKK
jgi:uncharacterized membrane protein